MWLRRAEDKKTIWINPTFLTSIEPIGKDGTETKFPGRTSITMSNGEQYNIHEDSVHILYDAANGISRIK